MRVVSVAAASSNKEPALSCHSGSLSRGGNDFFFSRQAAQAEGGTHAVELTAADAKTEAFLDGAMHRDCTVAPGLLHRGSLFNLLHHLALGCLTLFWGNWWLHCCGSPHLVI